VKVDIIITVIIEKDAKVLLIPSGGKLFKLPKVSLKTHESPRDTVRRIMKMFGVRGDFKIEGLVGIYSLVGSCDESCTFVFGCIVQAGNKTRFSKGKFFSKEELEKIVEEEKQLEDASINSMILKDYLLGEKYSLDIMKMVEEIKL